MTPHHHFSPRAATLFTAVLVSSAGGALLAQETVGNALVNRSEIDSAQGAIFVELQGFAQAGEVTSFAFYNDNATTAGRQLTPLLFEQVGSDFLIRGVGAAVANAASGAQNFAFQLQEGSNLVGPGFFFGYKNGTDDNASEMGIVEFDFVQGAISERFFGINFANNLDPGVNLGAGTFLGPDINQPERVYSVSATAVPEPASAALLAIGALSTAAMRRRRTA